MDLKLRTYISLDWFFQVTPSSKLDPCQSSLEQVSSELEKLFLGPENEVDEFLLKGEISQAAQLSLSVLASAKEKTECGQTVPVDIQHQVRKVNQGS